MPAPAIGLKKLPLKIMPMRNITLVSYITTGMVCRKTILAPATGMKKRLPKVMLLHNTILVYFIDKA